MNHAYKIHSLLKQKEVWSKLPFTYQDTYTGTLCEKDNQVSLSEVHHKQGNSFKSHIYSPVSITEITNQLLWSHFQPAGVVVLFGLDKNWI